MSASSREDDCLKQVESSILNLSEDEARYVRARCAAGVHWTWIKTRIEATRYADRLGALMAAFSDDDRRVAFALLESDGWDQAAGFARSRIAKAAADRSGARTGLDDSEP